MKPVRATLFSGMLALIVSASGLQTQSLALDPSTPITRYGHDVWGSHRGFPYFAIHALLQTKDGYLWLATDAGLVRFDGAQFTLFDKSNTPSIVHNDISSLAEDSSGILWFGTRGGGLGALRDGVFRRYTEQDGLSGSVVHSLCLDKSGALWIGLESFGLNRMFNGTFTRFSTAQTSDAPTVYVICETKDSTLFIGAGGLQRRRASGERFDNIRFQHLEFVKAVFEDHLGVTWIGTSRGLFMLRGDSTAACTISGAPASVPISCVYEDHQGNLWVGTEGHGLYRLSSGVFTRYSSEDGLSSDRVLSITEDREGNLWIGTRGGGLNRLRNQTLRTFSVEDGLSGEYVSAVFEDSRGSIWVSVRDQGVTEVRNGSVVRRYSAGNVPGTNHVRAIEEDAEGNILLGTMNGLVTISNAVSGIRAVVHPRGTLNSLYPYSIRAIRARNTRSVILGTYGGGVMDYTGGELKVLLPGSNVRSIAEAPDGSLWIASKGAVYHITGGEVRKFSPAEGLSSDEVFSLHCEHDGTVWAGTYGGGLNRIRDGKISPVMKQHGLFDDVVYSILDDDRGNFWMGCNRGVFRASKKDLNDVADGRLSDITCVSYGSEDGMKGVECNGGSQPSAWKTRDGRMLFATVKGFVIIDPARLGTQSNSVKYYIEQLVSEGDTLERRQTLTLPRGKRNLEIHYTGITFTGAEKLTFRYRIEGLEESWTEAGTRRRAYYTNIPPGTYTFRVVGGSSQERHETGEASMVLVIPPYFWETRWFMASAALLTILGVFVAARQISTRALRRRLRELEAQQTLEKERSRISQDMHDEVGASLTQIAILSELMERNLDKRDAAASYVRKISATAQEVVSSLDEIVWFINPKHDTLESLILYLREYLAGYFDSAEIACTFSTPDVIPQMKCSADLRRNIFLVAKEAANNIVKHAGATEINVELRLSGQMLEMLVRDNGAGADLPGLSSFGNGLRNMQKRMEDVGGTFALAASPLKGTSILARVPLTPQ